MPIEIKPDSSNPSPGPIKRRTFLGLGLTGVAGLSLPGLTRLKAQTAAGKPASKAAEAVQAASETTYWDRTDRFEEKLKLLEAAWQRKDFRLARALANFMLDVHSREHGYTEISPPYVVTRATMTATGQLPKFEEELYLAAADDLFLIPTAEVPVTNIHRDEILEAAELPKGYVAWTPCFRREAGSGGKDTRGLIRVHQFDKVELVRYCRPEDSEAEHERLTRHAETILERLEIPYRRLALAAGDTGFASARTWDLEVWAAGVGTWLEASSCSTFTDFQARRGNIRFRREPGAKPEFVHTLNGSGVAFPRTIIALLENNQAADGSVRLPAALVPYMGTDRLVPRA